MLHLRLTLLAMTAFFSGCIVIPTYTANISLGTTRYNEQKVQVKNMLLIGTGPVASEIFLENLSTEMTKSLKQKSVQCRFSYIGKIPQAGPLKIDNLLSDEFDAYLVFKASDQSYLDMNKQKFKGYGPGVVTTGYGNQFADTYALTLYTRKKTLQIVWQGDLRVDFDLANDSRYKQISNLIFNELVKNRVLPN